MPEQAQQKQPADSSTQATPKKGISWKKIIVSVVVIVMVAGIISGLLWYFACNQTESSTTETTKVSTPSSKQATPSAKKDETVDWKTLKATNFSFKYPSSWEEHTTTGSEGKKVYYITTKDKVNRYFGIETKEESYTGSFQDWCSKDVVCDGSKPKEKNIDGVDVYQHISLDEQAANSPGAWNYIQHESNIYMVTWNASALNPTNYEFDDIVKEFNKPIFEQIFSTFKFLD